MCSFLSFETNGTGLRTLSLHCSLCSPLPSDPLPTSPCLKTSVHSQITGGPPCPGFCCLRELRLAPCGPRRPLLALASPPPALLPASAAGPQSAGCSLCPETSLACTHPLGDCGSSVSAPAGLRPGPGGPSGLSAWSLQGISNVTETQRLHPHPRQSPGCL